MANSEKKELKGTEMNEQNNKIVQNVADSYRYICTMTADTFEGKRAIIKARNNAFSLNDVGSDPFVLVGVQIVPGVRSRTGEKCANVYLFTNDDKVYFTQSSGVYRSVMDIYDMFHDFNAPAGIPVAVQTVQLDNGRTLKSLDIQ